MLTRTLLPLLAGAPLALASDPPAAERPPAAPALWWGDLNADGRADAFVVHPDGAARLMLNRGDGAFEDATERLGLGDLRGHHMAAFGDANADGLADLYLPAWRGASRLFVQQPDGTLSDETEARGLPLHAEPLDARWLDVDGDGALDLWLTTLIDDLVYLNDGAGRFAKAELGVLPRELPLDGVPADVDQARALRGIGPDDGGGTFAPGPPATQPVCALGVFDQANPGACLPASSVPTAGHLLAVGSAALVPNLNADRLDGFDSSAFSQFGALVDTAEIAAKAVTGNEIAANAVGAVHIAAGAVGTSEVADGSLTAADLSADSVGASELAAGSVGASELAAGTILDVHVSAAAAIAGTKIVPDFGGQDLVALGAGDFGNGAPTDYKVKGDGGFGPTNGYLGAQGTVDFDGVTSADWTGWEIGVAGVSTGTSDSDNYGVLGHANLVGVRGEFSGNPAKNYGELGANGVGVYGIGTTYAGQFTGRVFAEHSIVDSVLNVVNHASGNAAEFEIDNAAAAGTTMVVKHQGTGGTASFTNSNAATITATVFASSQATNVSHRTLHVVNQGAGSAQAAFFDLNNTGSTATSTWIRNRGTGLGLMVESEGSGSAGRFVQFDRNGSDHASGNDILQINTLAGSSDTSQFVEFERGTDIEFRVDGDGDVFADGAYTGPADFAEMLAVSTGARSVEPGDVVAIDPGGVRSVIASSEPYSRLVAGVYSTQPGFVGSERDFAGAVGPNGERRALKRADMAELYDEVPVAVVGIVPCKVSGQNGAIRPGDLLVTSSVLGHAMVDNDPPVGTVVGKALEPFDGDRGVIRILVTLQ